jgi:hypothetical protein
MAAKKPVAVAVIVPSKPASKKASATKVAMVVGSKPKSKKC